MNQLALVLDPIESRRRKKEGMDLTAAVNSDWLKVTLADLKEYAVSTGIFTMEAFRWHQVSRGRPQPSSDKCWGSLGSSARRKGIIEGTGRMVPAASIKTHSHKVEVVRCALEPIPFAGYV